jgi:hypothetical protein
MANDTYTLLEKSELTGYSLRRSRGRQAAIAAAAALWGDVFSGSVPRYLLSEALQPRTPALVRAIDSNYPGIISLHETHTRSDFAQLTGDVLGRMSIARYNEFPSPWRQFAKVTANLTDFRPVKRIPLNGLEGAWPEQMEDEELEYGALAEGTAVTLTARKYALGVRLSFELIINDDLNAFSSIPDRLGRGGARTVNRAVTATYVGVNGPLATVYSAPNGNIVVANASLGTTINPVLSIASLSAAYGQLRGMTDTQGQPIMMEAAVLVVPPALEVVARNILQAITIRTTSAGGASGQELEVANWLGTGLTLAVDPYIPVIATTANGNTSWFLFAAPSTGNPAIEVAFLTGYAAPVIYQRATDTMRVGDGMDQEAGSFATMSNEWKGVVAFGTAVLSVKSTVASNGSGV